MPEIGLFDAIYSARALRRLKPDPVPEELITRILDAAANLLAMSPDGDISTRAVCDAARIGAPVLYRQFGDKQGLLAAVVDHGFDAYLTAKQARKPTADPVENLRAGWDSHIAFALSNRNLS